MATPSRSWHSDLMSARTRRKSSSPLRTLWLPRYRRNGGCEFNRGGSNCTLNLLSSRNGGMMSIFRLGFAAESCRPIKLLETISLSTVLIVHSLVIGGASIPILFDSASQGSFLKTSTQLENDSPGSWQQYATTGSLLRLRRIPKKGENDLGITR